MDIPGTGTGGMKTPWGIWERWGWVSVGSRPQRTQWGQIPYENKTPNGTMGTYHHEIQIPKGIWAKGGMGLYGIKTPKGTHP